MTAGSSAKRWLKSLVWHDAVLGSVLILATLLGVKAIHSRLPSPPKARTVIVPQADQRAQIVVRVNAEKPLAGATVRVFEELESGEFPEIAQAETPAGGELTLPVTPGAPLWVLAEAPGTQRRSRHFSVPPSEPIDFVLQPAQSLRVTVVDDQHEPIKQATVLVRDADPLPFGGLTDAAGAVVFARLGSPPYKVEVFARGYESALLSEVEKEQKVVLRRLGSIAVRVLKPDGSPAAKAVVSVVGSSLWPTRRTEASAKGKVKLRGLFPGLYDLRAELGGMVSEVMSAVNLARGENKQVELRLRQGRYIRVRVVDAEEEPKFPVDGARVVLTELGLSSFPMSAVTNKAGETRIGPVTEGPAYLSARADGFVGRGAVPIPADPPVPLEIALLKGGTLRGIVVDSEDRPIPGARVEIVGLDSDGLPIAETPLLSAMREAHFQWSMNPLPLVPAGELGITIGPVPFVQSLLNAAQAPASEAADWTSLPQDYSPWISRYDGEFKAFPVPPGRVRALVRHPAYVESLSDQVTIGPGGSARVKVVMRQGAELLGRVVSEAGRPVPGARVQVTAQKGSFQRSTITRSDGMFRFSAVPAHVSIALARPDELTRFVVRKTLELKDSVETEMEFELPAARELIRFRVVDEDDRPIELVQVTFMSVDADVPLRTTRFSDARGFVSVEDAAGLSLRVSARAPGYMRFSEQLKSAPEERTVVMRVGVWVQGKVTGVRGRVEIGGARVKLVSGDFTDIAYTNERGSYEFRQVPVGRASLTAAHDDYARATVSASVVRTGHPERAFEIETIDLASPSSVSGLVLDAQGEPVKGARVGLSFIPAFVPRGRVLDDTVVSDADGAFTLRGLSPGAHTLHAYAASVGRGQADVQVQAGDEKTDLRLSLTESGEPAELGISAGGVAVTLAEQDTSIGVRVVVAQISPRSEASRAGLRTGDVLGELDGVPPRDMRDARERLSGKPGTDVVVTVVRGGKKASFRVRREPLTR